jgi:hypothetical protein
VPIEPFQRRAAKTRLRDIEAMVAGGGRSQELGEALQAQGRQMFHAWQWVCDGTLTHASFRPSMQPIRWEVERLLEAGQPCGAPKTAGTCGEVCKRRQALWTFVRQAGVEPTNNAPECAPCPGMLWRTESLGIHSADGSRLVEAMMTVAATLKPQHRHVLDDLTAAWYGEPPPSLRPTPRELTKSMCPAA